MISRSAYQVGEPPAVVRGSSWRSGTSRAGCRQPPLALCCGRRPDIALWTLYPSRRLLSARVSAFLDFLKAAFPTGAPEELAAFVAG